MDAFLILTALLFAVILLFRVAVPTAKPRFSGGEYLSRSALIDKMTLLGKKCAVTRKGFGIAYRKYNINRLYAAVNGSDNNADLWEKELENSRTLFCSAYKKSLQAVRLLYTLGHVDGYPRLFLFCNELVKCCQGDISVKKLNLAISAFEKHSPLTKRESELLCGTLAFCVLGFLNARAHMAIKKKKIYGKGMGDGAANKIDLDSMTNVDYACGIYDASRDKTAVMQVFETNGIDCSEMLFARKKYLAEMYALIKAAERSLAALQKSGTICVKEIAPAENSTKIKKQVVFIVPSVAIIVTAVLSCIFLPVEYAAIVPVTATVLYGCFRLPMLQVLPSIPFLDKLIDKIHKLISHMNRRRAKSEVSNNDIDNRMLAEAAFFGCEAEHITNVFTCKNKKFICDNRGSVGFTCGNNDSVKDRICITLTVGNKTISLIDCDGVHENCKSVYRCFDDDFEFCAQFAASSDSDSCCCKITIINRTNVRKKMNLLCVTNISDIGLSETRTESNSARTCFCNGKFLSIACDGAAIFKNADHSSISLNAELEFESEPHKKFTTVFAAAYGNSALEAERLSEHTASDGMFDYLCDCNNVFAGEFSGGKEEVTEEFCRLCSHVDKDKKLYSVPELPPFDYAVNSNSGGYLIGGEFVAELIGDTSDANKNILTDGMTEITTYGNRICGVIANKGKCKAGKTECSHLTLDDVVVALSENGVLWSPLKGVFEGGKYSAVFGFGHTTYLNANNGCVSKLTCCLSQEIGVILFDLFVENFESIDRKITVMFSAVSSEESENSVVLSSEEVFERTEFKEGYFVRGKIDRACGFRRGGSTRATTTAVRILLPANGKRRIIFAIKSNFGGVDLIDTQFFDSELAAAKTRFGSDGRIRLLSSDSHLNILYKRVKYAAHIFALSEIKSQSNFLGAACVCMKYFDRETSRKYLLDALRQQKRSGAFGDGKYAILGVLYAVCDHAEFTEQYELLYKHVKYAPHYSGGSVVTETGNVLEHILRAVKNLPCDCKDNGEAVRVLYCKALLRVLEFLKKNTNGEISEKLDKARIAVVNNYAEAVSSFKHSEVPISGDTLSITIFASAMYCCGKYEKAYAALKQAFKLFEREKSGAGATLLYYVITEWLIGVKFRGKTVKINPRIAADCPHIEFELISDNGGATRIIVDETNSDGEWRMRINKINYASDNIGFTDKSSDTVVFYRSGH